MSRYSAARPGSAGQLGGQGVVQAQGDVGVFGGVFGGAGQLDLVEADLLGALAADSGVGEGLEAQVAAGQGVHVVGLVALEHVGFEQGVFRDAGSGCRGWPGCGRRT